jgi:hypothetical protein
MHWPVCDRLQVREDREDPGTSLAGGRPRHREVSAPAGGGGGGSRGGPSAAVRQPAACSLQLHLLGGTACLHVCFVSYAVLTTEGPLMPVPSLHRCCSLARRLLCTACPTARPGRT